MNPYLLYLIKKIKVTKKTQKTLQDRIFGDFS